MAWAIYRNAPVAPHLSDVVEEAWQLLPEPDDVHELPNLNWFEPTSRFYSTRQARLDSVVNALERLEAGRALETKVVTTRYTEGLPDVADRERAALASHLNRFSS